jgi:hypothetical protein
MCRIALRGVPGTEVASEEEQIDNAHDDPKPEALPLHENESFPDADDARNPEKLAGNQRHEEGGEEQEIEGPLAPIGHEHQGAKNNPRKNDVAHALVSFDKADYRRCRLRFLGEHSAAIIRLAPVL